MFLKGRCHITKRRHHATTDSGATGGLRAPKVAARTAPSGCVRSTDIIYYEIIYYEIAARGAARRCLRRNKIGSVAT